MQKNTPTTDTEMKKTSFSPEYRRLQKATNRYYAALNRAIERWHKGKEGKRLEAEAQEAKAAYEIYREKKIKEALTI